MSSNIKKNISKIINDISQQELNIGKISDDKKNNLQQIFNTINNSDFNYESYIIKIIQTKFKEFKDISNRNNLITNIKEIFNEEKRKQEEEKRKQEEEKRKKNRILDLVNRNIIEKQDNQKQINNTLPTETPQQNTSIFKQNENFPIKEKTIDSISPPKMSTEVSDKLFEILQKDLTKNNIIKGKLQKLQENTNEKYLQFFELINTTISANLITYTYKYTLNNDPNELTSSTPLNQFKRNISEEEQYEFAKKHFIDAIITEYKKYYSEEIEKMNKIIQEQEQEIKKNIKSHKYAKIYPKTSDIKEYISVYKYDKLQDYKNINLEYDFYHELTNEHKENIKNIKNIIEPLTITDIETIYKTNQLIKQEQTQNNNYIFVILFEKIINNNEICSIKCKDTDTSSICIECKIGDKLNNVYFYDTLYFTENEKVYYNIRNIFSDK
jgi:hypothetical protein